KGMTFNIQRLPAPASEETATEDQAAAPQKNNTKVETRASCIAGAKDLTQIDIPAQENGADHDRREPTSGQALLAELLLDKQVGRGGTE
ncbi:MAG: hypothetical protein ACKPKO_36615, partial [Candidatus Fonsibacter sp.]